MITYVLEFALIHTLCFLIYKLLLSKETQLGFLRFFILGSTALSLIVPLIEIPNNTPLPTFNLDAILISGSVSSSDTPIQEITVPWYVWAISIVGTLILIKTVLSLISIWRHYKKSISDEVEGMPVRKVVGLNNSFTFFKWIFIDPALLNETIDIVRHEWGHSKKLHSLDILLFNLLTVLFWWVPTVWLMIKELRKVHEYEADQYALQAVNATDYIKTLVHSTLKAHRLNLASSFDDAPIVKRLNFIKQMKKNVSPWKTGSIAALMAITGLMFACQDELDAEIKRIADESHQQVMYSEDVEAALRKLQEGYPDAEFMVIETKIANKESLDKLNKYDPSQIKYMSVNKNGDDQTVTMIVDKSAKLFGKVTDLHLESNSGDATFTIVEQMPEYPGGKEALANYLMSKITISKTMSNSFTSGVTYVQFTVDENGKVIDPMVVKSSNNSEFDVLAVKAIAGMEDWVPGTQKGKAVKVKMVIPVKFAS